MPTSPPRPCRAPMCAGKTTHKHGYCDKHADQAVAWKKPDHKRSGRGGRPWRRLRDAVMRRDRYLCQCDDCIKESRITPAHEVDHIIPLSRGGKDLMSNLRAISRDCHKRKTNREKWGD
ncbi:HNH endonuclease [Halomonas campaniensis]|uniref:HNH nuclease domain-containing protein n=1 Tax=Halomonas campaniensis TaxID=213554 RepID=A0A246RZS3_9GAMM|nr:hypothetical protein JI62_11675 [Halomonas campaniensis]